MVTKSVEGSIQMDRALDAGKISCYRLYHHVLRLLAERPINRRTIVKKPQQIQPPILQFGHFTPINALENKMKASSPETSLNDRNDVLKGRLY